MKVGDYVRTKEGYICKILEMHEEYDDEYLDWNDIGSASIRKSHIIKLSPNIIDLIEVGDYVNGNKIIKICNDFAGRKILVYGYDDGERQVAITIYEEDIKSIVTKEQFEQMEYKIN